MDRKQPFIFCIASEEGIILSLSEQLEKFASCSDAFDDIFEIKNFAGLKEWATSKKTDTSIYLKKKKNVCFDGILTKLSSKSGIVYHIQLKEISSTVPAINLLHDIDYLTVFEKIPDIINIVDNRGYIVYINKPPFNQTNSDIVGKHFLEFIPEEEKEHRLKNFQKTLAGNEVHISEIKSQTNGKPDWLVSYSLPFSDRSTGEKYVFTLSRFITESKKIESLLKESEKRFRKLVESAEDIIYRCNQDGKFDYVNPVATKITGYTTEDVEGKHFTELIREDFRADAVDFYAYQFKNRVNNTYKEIPVITKEGNEVWIGQNVQIITENDWVIGFQAQARDITERRKVQQELVKAKQIAEDSLMAKEQFLSVMSHEIRTPLNAVIGLTNLLIEENPKRNQIEHLQGIKFSADNLLNIINDILDFSKIESGKISLENTNIEIVTLLNNIRKTFQQEARKKGITLQLMYSQDLPEVIVGDPVRLNQILLNLVGNAVKFTHKGIVKIECSLKKEYNQKVILHFKISDTGIGIDPERKEKIFESFTQASEDTSRKYGGTGLGLTITKKLVELYGGKIKVKSKVREGSVFEFDLKFNTHSGDPINKKKKTLQKNFENLNVLIVEDNEMNQLVAGRYLQKWGIKVSTALNGQEALDKIDEMNFDLILMDLEMPVLNGYEASKRIRNLTDKQKKSTPIIALSASSFSKVKEKLFENGINDYLPKPFDAEELYKKISYFTRKDSITEGDLTSYQSSRHSENGIKVDFSYLENAAGGDKDFINQMINTFVTRTPEYLREIDKYRKNQQYDRLRIIAHKFKATVSIVGVQDIRMDIEKLEQLIDEGIENNKLDRLVDMIIQKSNLACEMLLETKEDAY